MRRLIFISFILHLSLTAVAMGGSASGQITINGKSSDFAYAYAWKTPNVFNAKEIRTVVLLSDRKIADTALGRSMELNDLARDGKFTGVQVEITPEGKIAIGKIYSSAFPGGWLSASGMHQLQTKQFTATLIEGRLFMNTPDTWGPPNSAGIKYFYSAAFKTDIQLLKKP